MSNNKHLDRVKILSSRAYPLPRVHNAVHGIVAPSTDQRKRSKLGLGVNEKTGRLQWCPGLTCCKLFIVLTVVMLPVTLVLIILMRMDGLLAALKLHQQQQQAYNLSSNDLGKDLISQKDFIETQLMPTYEVQSFQESQCIGPQHGLSEMFAVGERNIMKDARTSFLPYDLTAMPLDCLDELNYGGAMEEWPVETNISEYKAQRKRTRRSTLNNRKRNAKGLQSDSVAMRNSESTYTINDEVAQESSQSKEETQITQTVASLDSFWNEQGTKDAVRKAQAKTMMKYMDRKVDPCKDFYKYACGNWERLHPIPKDKAGFDTFEMLRESLDNVLKQLLESPTSITRNDGNKRAVLTPIKSNHYEHNPNTQADITAIAAAAANIENEETAEKEEEKLRLRRHIIEQRETLERILERFKRQNININTSTNTKRKRLVDKQNSHLSNRHAITENDDPSADFEGLENAQVKAKKLYQSCINSKLLAKRGIEPLLKLIDDLGGWPVLNSNWSAQNFDWLSLTAKLRRYNNDILIVQWVGPDIKNSDENVIQFDQTSLGLPTREYFLQDVNSKYLLAYQRFMSEVMHKLGVAKNVAQKTAAELIAFETQLASITSPAELRLNVTKLYKRMSLKELSTLVPQINWQRYLTILQERSVKDSEDVVIFAADYMTELVSLIAETEPRTLSNYLIWRFVRHRINNVDDRFDDTKQHFYHALFGREESPSRWKVCVAQVNTNMGMAVGSMFVSRYFDENSKRDTLRMTHEIQQAFRDILRSTEWIDQQTKKLAEEKVNAMSLKIGYPDFILNPGELNDKYQGLDIHPERYFENTLNVLLHTAQTEQQRLTERVNKTHWQTAPAIVNAYYSRNKNQIMFPAGILQPPFYHRHFPRALNFGGIGVVIGHELTHGFDDKGRLFDSNGNIHKWWSDYAIRGFDDRARCIISQYGNYTVSEVGITLNGESTQGENIADNGGLRQAFHSYSNWLKNNPDQVAEESLPGLNLTGPQLFFLNFGQVWCGAMRPEAIRNKLNTAIHSPGRFRVIGTLSNSYDFAREFNCAVNAEMNPIRKCTVW